jgi:hypothetical protein
MRHDVCSAACTLSSAAAEQTAISLERAPGWSPMDRTDSRILEFERSIVAGLHYLRRHLMPSGRFNYLYDAASNRVSKDYNLLRHAGTTLVLHRLVGFCADDVLIAKGAERALAYLLRFLGALECDGSVRLCLVDRGVVRLGGTALTVLALAAKLDRSMVLEALDEATLAALSRHLLSQLREDGRFTSKCDFLTGEEMPFQSLYYPGQAILALCAAYRTTGDSDFLKGAVRAAAYSVSERTRMGSTGQRNASQDMAVIDHWLMMALNAVHVIDRNDRWIEPLRLLAEPMLVADETVGDSQTPSSGWSDRATTAQLATRVEGLLAVLDAELRLKEWRRAAILRRAIVSGLTRCLERQVDPIRMSGFNRRADGGFLTRVSQSWIRIDSVQHVLAALSGAVELLTAVDSPPAS